MVSKKWKAFNTRNYLLDIMFSEGLPIGVIVSDFPHEEDLIQSNEDDDTEEYFSADDDFSNVKPQLTPTIQTVDVCTQTDPHLTSTPELCPIL